MNRGESFYIFLTKKNFGLKVFYFEFKWLSSRYIFQVKTFVQSSSGGGMVVEKELISFLIYVFTQSDVSENIQHNLVEEKKYIIKNKHGGSPGRGPNQAHYFSFINYL